MAARPGPVRISNSIRRLRFDRGEMTQAQLAERIGVTRQTVIAIEGGKYSPTLELAFRIAAAFGVSLGEVFRCEFSGGDGASGQAPPPPASPPPTGRAPAEGRPA